MQKILAISFFFVANNFSETIFSSKLSWHYLEKNYYLAIYCLAFDKKHAKMAIAIAVS